MHNEVLNIVMVNGTPLSTEMATLFRDILDQTEGFGTIDFNKIIPMPPGLYRGPMSVEEYDENNTEMMTAKHWCIWAEENWGTPWTPFDFNNTQEAQDSYSVMSFRTIDEPPHPVIERLSEFNPQVTIEHKWSYCGRLGTGGTNVYKAGKLTIATIDDIDLSSCYHVSKNAVVLDRDTAIGNINTDIYTAYRAEASESM